MKNNFILIIITIFCFLSCTNDNDGTLSSSATTTLKFTHNWNTDVITSADFNTIQYTNENGQMLSIERLRYVISDITFRTNAGENLILDDYNLIDLTNDDGLSYSTNQIPIGNYVNVSFTFGFDNEDNAENYLDLNSESFNVPDMLGGGYHYMQFDGKYLDTNSNEQGFNYHAIRAVDNPGMNPTFPQDTFFTVNLGPITVTNDIEIEIKANLAEWFKSPNLWDLNVLNQTLMPNSSAQIMMSENGQTVFSLGDITNN
ncbi:MbnP family protein [Winogradskyella sp. UBA3174]|uniref:MbnP family protein n=1 Tax=Winogradskyella sp. UBA3174 TaxID=1947785 RepID=UPI0025CE2B0A|nr:MbnP family protein [Winogradskyella sp. UBA3174]